MAYLITLDGMSGTGKSTQLCLLEDYISETYGLAVHTFKEPTEFIRPALKDYRVQPKERRDALVESYLLAADRRHQFVTEIEPLLAGDGVILMDRSKYSAYAYQGEDIPLEELIAQNSFFPDADLPLFLLCEPETAAERIALRGEGKSGDEHLARLACLKGRFEAVASEAGAHLIYAGGSEGAVFHQLRSHVDALLGREMSRIVFLDKDGVLVDNSCYPGRIPTDELYPESFEALRTLKDAGFLLTIVSNQSWIGKGRMTQEEVEAVFRSVLSQYAAAGVQVDGYLYCPHTREDGCACKKPGTGMLEKIIGEVNGDTRSSFMVGDMAKDIEAGRNCGLTTVLLERGDAAAPGKWAPDHTARTLLEAAAVICGSREA